MRTLQRERELAESRPSREDEQSRADDFKRNAERELARSKVELEQALLAAQAARSDAAAAEARLREATRRAFALYYSKPHHAHIRALYTA